MQKLTILIVATEMIMRRSLQILVQNEGYEAIASSGADILSGSWKPGSPDLIISYVDAENTEEGLEIIRRIRRRELRVPIILITSFSSKDLAAEAQRIGISNHLTLPVSPQDLVSSINSSLSFPRLISDADGEVTAPDSAMENQMVGRSPAMAKLIDYLRKVAMTDCTVLITGETGTGKELVANSSTSTVPGRKIRW